MEQSTRGTSPKHSTLQSSLSVLSAAAMDRFTIRRDTPPELDQRAAPVAEAPPLDHELMVSTRKRLSRELGLDEPTPRKKGAGRPKHDKLWHDALQSYVVAVSRGEAPEDPALSPSRPSWGRPGLPVSRAPEVLSAQLEGLGQDDLGPVPAEEGIPQDDVDTVPAEEGIAQDDDDTLIAEPEENLAESEDGRRDGLQGACEPAPETEKQSRFRLETPIKLWVLD